ncbi:MAG: hypothetical protein Q8L78_01195 [Coxiellaceae bacterium]|nr:hypothetical protein [Coxiellaceae bacterium]
MQRQLELPDNFYVKHAIEHEGLNTHGEGDFDPEKSVSQAQAIFRAEGAAQVRKKKLIVLQCTALESKDFAIRNLETLSTLLYAGFEIALVMQQKVIKLTNPSLLAGDAIVLPNKFLEARDISTYVWDAYRISADAFITFTLDELYDLQIIEENQNAFKILHVDFREEKIEFDSTSRIDLLIANDFDYGKFEHRKILTALEKTFGFDKIEFWSPILLDASDKKNLDYISRILKKTIRITIGNSLNQSLFLTHIDEDLSSILSLKIYSSSITPHQLSLLLNRAKNLEFLNLDFLPAYLINQETLSSITKLNNLTELVIANSPITTTQVLQLLTMLPTLCYARLYNCYNLNKEAISAFCAKNLPGLSLTFEPVFSNSIDNVAKPSLDVKYYPDKKLNATQYFFLPQTAQYSEPLVNYYRLTQYDQLKITKKRCDQADAVERIEADPLLSDIDLIPLKPSNQDLYKKACVLSNKNQFVYYGKKLLSLTEKWQALPSLSSDEKITDYHFTVHAQDIEIAYSQKNKQYYIRSKKNKPIQTTIDFIVETPKPITKPAASTSELPSYIQSILQETATFRLDLKGDWNNTEKTGAEHIQRLIKRKVGACRIRAMVAKYRIDTESEKYNQIPKPIVTIITNDIHDFIEIQFRGEIFSVCLGGYPSNVNLNKDFEPKKITNDEIDVEKSTLEATPEAEETEALKAEETQSKKALFATHHIINQFEKAILVTTTFDSRRSAYDFQKIAHETSKMCFYANAPEDLICAVPYIERDAANNKGEIKKGPGGRLFEFLQACIGHPNQPAIIVINFDHFSTAEAVRVNTLFDNPSSIDGIMLPPNIKIIAIAEKNNALHSDASFTSRFDVSVSLAENTTPLPIIFESGDPKAKEEATKNAVTLNLYHTKRWRDHLLGKWALNGNELYYLPGALIAHLQAGNLLSELIIQNAPDDPEFEFFLREAKLKGYIEIGKDKIPFPENVALYTQPNCLLSDENITSIAIGKPNKNTLVLNAHTFNQFFYNNYYDSQKQCMVHQAGFLEQNTEKEISVYVHHLLTAMQGLELLDVCKKYGVKLAVIAASSDCIPPHFKEMFNIVEPEHAEPTTLAQDQTYFIETSDRDVTLKKYQAENKAALVIDISEMKASDLLKKLNGTFDHEHLCFRFSEAECCLLKALREGKTVILQGEITLSLANTLTEFLLKRVHESSPVGKLIFISENNNPWRNLVVDSHHTVTAQEKRALLKKEFPSYTPPDDAQYFEQPYCRLAAYAKSQKDSDPWCGLDKLPPITTKKRSLYLSPIDPNLTFSETEQRGETCKLFALSGLMDYDIAMNASSKERVPLYKRHRLFHKHKTSLRQIAKERTGSVVGEMYSVEALQKTAETAGFSLSACSFDNQEAYINSILGLLNKNIPAMVIFDVNQYTGLPNVTQNSQKIEHAGIVVGSTIQSGRRYFQVRHWGKIYDFDAELLARSALSLQDERTPEQFIKIKSTYSAASKWSILSYDNSNPVAQRRTSSPKPKAYRSMKGVLFYILPGKVVYFSLSKKISDDFMCARVDAFEKMLSEKITDDPHDTRTRPYLFLAGMSGVGKTTFVEQYCHQPDKGKYLFRHAQLHSWAQMPVAENETRYLFIDEATLKYTDWSQFEGLFHAQPSIVIDGEYIELSPQHKVIFAGNPVSYSGDRKLGSLFERHAGSLVFEPFLPECIYESILKPLFLDASLTDSQIQEITTPILLAYQFLMQLSEDRILISPRELAMAVLLTLHYAKEHQDRNLSEVASYYIRQLSLPFVPENKKEYFAALLPSTYTPKKFTVNQTTFSFTERQAPIIGLLTDFITLRAQQRKDLNFPTFAGKGLGGVILEGLPGIGKSTIAITLLCAHGFKQGDENAPISNEALFYKIAASWNTEKVKNTLIKAYYEGNPVIWDEMNAAVVTFESFMNDLLMNKIPDDPIAKKAITEYENSGIKKQPGFFVIATQNPPTMAGRKQTSDAILHRMHHCVLPEYTKEELIKILYDKHLPLAIAEKHVTAFLQEDLEKQSVRVLFRNIDRLIEHHPEYKIQWKQEENEKQMHEIISPEEKSARKKNENEEALKYSLLESELKKLNVSARQQIYEDSNSKIQNPGLFQPQRKIVTPCNNIEAFLANLNKDQREALVRFQNEGVTLDHIMALPRVPSGICNALEQVLTHNPAPAFSIDEIIQMMRYFAHPLLLANIWSNLMKAKQEAVSKDGDVTAAMENACGEYPWMSPITPNIIKIIAAKFSPKEKTESGANRISGPKAS